MERLKVLVTGAFGFLGSHLARAARIAGFAVHAVRSPRPVWPHRLPDFEGLAIHSVDLANYERLRQVFRKVKPDIVLHTAARGMYDVPRPISKIYLDNLASTINVVEVSEECGVGFLVNTGTCYEYAPSYARIDEHARLGPRTPYATSKLLSTLFCTYKGQNPGIQVLTLRIFSMYGPHDYPSRLIPHLIRCTLQKRSPQIADPNLHRDFIYVEDAANAFISAITKRDSLNSGEVINIGTGIDSSIASVCEAISNHSSCFCERENVTRRRPAYSEGWVADPYKAQRTLRWKARVGLAEGISRTVMSIRDDLSHRESRGSRGHGRR